MAGSLNKVMLIGRLGRDPEVRHTGSGTAVANFSMATSDRRKSQSGEWEEHTEWHAIVAFGKLADICQKYLNKGKQIYIVGRLQTRMWQDKEGQQRRKTEVVADEMVMLGSKGDGARPSGGAGGGEEEAGESTGPIGKGGKKPPAGGGDEPMSGSVPGDDDIPF